MILQWLKDVCAQLWSDHIADYTLCCARKGCGQLLWHSHSIRKQGAEFCCQRCANIYQIDNAV